MTKSARHVAIIAIVLSTLSGLAFAQNRANNSTAQANLNIRVNVVQAVMTDQNPKSAEETGISYSIPMVQPRMSVTKEIHKVHATDGKSSIMVETTTIVAE